jgi:hypothetical protein
VTRASPALAAFREPRPESQAPSTAPEDAIDARTDLTDPGSDPLDSLDQTAATAESPDDRPFIDDTLIDGPSFVHPVEEEPPYDLADDHDADIWTDEEDRDAHPA